MTFASPRKAAGGKQVRSEAGGRRAEEKEGTCSSSPASSSQLPYPVITHSSPLSINRSQTVPFSKWDIVPGLSDPVGVGMDLGVEN